MTSYTSISPRRRHHDPKPWQYLGERHASLDDILDPFENAANLHAFTWAYAPRPEHIDVTTLPTNSILDAMRDNWDDGDPFGSAMSWLGAICDVLEWNGDGDLARPEWGYRPSVFGADTDSYEYTEIDEIVGNLPRGRDDALPMLDHAGRVLNRIIDMATLAGLDY